MAEGGALLRRYGGELLHRGFESLLLRQYDQRMIRRVLPVVLVAGALLVGGTASARTATVVRPPNVIRLVSITTAESSVDLKPKGKANPGDHETFASRLLNQRPQFGKKKGAVVGSDSGSLRVTSTMIPLFVTTARLPGGTILVRGTLKPIGNGAYRIAVVGGTGVFALVRGTLTILKPTNPKTAVNVYRLIYPLVA